MYEEPIIEKKQEVVSERIVERSYAPVEEVVGKRIVRVREDEAAQYEASRGTRGTKRASVVNLDRDDPEIAARRRTGTRGAEYDDGSRLRRTGEINANTRAGSRAQGVSSGRGGNTYEDRYYDQDRKESYASNKQMRSQQNAQRKSYKDNYDSEEEY